MLCSFGVLHLYVLVTCAFNASDAYHCYSPYYISSCVLRTRHCEKLQLRLPGMASPPPSGSVLGGIMCQLSFSFESLMISRIE